MIYIPCGNYRTQYTSFGKSFTAVHYIYRHFISSVRVSFESVLSKDYVVASFRLFLVINVLKREWMPVKYALPYFC